MADPQEMEQGEQMEDAAFQKIMQLCQQGSASPQSAIQALKAIAAIIQQLGAHNQQEEQEMGGQEGGGSMEDRVMQRIQDNRAAQAGGGQPPQGK